MDKKNEFKWKYITDDNGWNIHEYFDGTKWSLTRRKEGGDTMAGKKKAGKKKY